MTEILTERNSAPCNAELPAPPRRRPSPRPSPETLHSATTEREPSTESDTTTARPDLRETLARIRAFCTPPALLTEQRPAADTMRAYARRARYTSQTTGPLRTLGVAWCNGIAVPYVAWSRTKEWLVERPARVLVVAVTCKALSELPPVEWTVDNIVKPGAGFAFWLFL